MKLTFFKILILLIISMFLNNCSVGDLSSLWPTESEENQEVTIREIVDESFDPEDTEEIEMPDIDNDISSATVSTSLEDIKSALIESFKNKFFTLLSI